jgi:hypothetical protein
MLGLRSKIDTLGRRARVLAVTNKVWSQHWARREAPKEILLVERADQAMHEQDRHRVTHLENLPTRR